MGVHVLVHLGVIPLLFCQSDVDLPKGDRGSEIQGVPPSEDPPPLAPTHAPSSPPGNRLLGPMHKPIPRPRAIAGTADTRAIVLNSTTVSVFSSHLRFFGYPS